ncbi:MAG: hypothetical protein EPO67_15740 [Reyranella sp.]|nr:MAG: hypothetical protein EPO67_15740 [Reyranella sp.]
MIGSAAGCSAPVGIEASNRDASYQKKITRVLVTVSIRSPDLSPTQNEGFVRAAEIRQSLTAAWGPSGVAVEVIDLAAGQSAGAAVASFAPQQILSLTLQAYQLYRYVVDAYTVDASLLDVATNRRVWRTTVQFRGLVESGRIRHSGLGGAISHQNDADDLAQALTAKLKTDGLL